MVNHRKSLKFGYLVAAVTLLAVLVSAPPLHAQKSAATVPGNGQGWTGITQPADMINARQMLMFTIEDLMRPIDTYTVDDSIEPDEITEHAMTIATMLQATPHLFAPTTNLFDPEDEYPATLALPAVWQQFDAFYALADAATSAALTLAEAGTPDELRSGALALRASCDACHGAYLNPYERGEVREEDKNFDFDSVFGN